MKNNNVIRYGLVVFSMLMVSTAFVLITDCAEAQMFNVSYQEGFSNDFVTDYEGTEDAMLRGRWEDGTAYYERMNYGGSNNFEIGTVWNSRKFRSVMRWDLSSLAGQYPAQDGIESASLTFTAHIDAVSSGTVHLFALKPANAGWVEGTLTGTEPTAGTPGVTWGWLRGHHVAGSRIEWEPGSDAAPYQTGPTFTGNELPPENDGYYNDPIGSFSWDSSITAGTKITFELNGIDAVGDGSLTALIDLWSGDQADNPGFIMITNRESLTNDTYRLLLRSSEHDTEEDRPLLDLTVIPEPSTFTLLGLAGVLLFCKRRR